jgi:hypothetical protein
VEERPEGAVDECRGLIESELPHVAQTKIELHACFFSSSLRLVHHGLRKIDPDDASTGRRGDGDRDAAVPDTKFDDRAVRFASQAYVERHVFRHLRRPLVVAPSERFVPAHQRMLRRAHRRDRREVAEHS